MLKYKSTFPSTCMFRNVNEVGEYLHHILSLSASLYSVGPRQFLSSNPRNNDQTPAVDPGLPLCQHLHGDD